VFPPAFLAKARPTPRGSPTDEAAAVEQLGLKPRVVAGSRENLKVTWPEDVAIAEAILRRRA
jgi:2-C-methyl-D-erythritol 4-phosphate cytidylyltransferase